MKAVNFAWIRERIGRTEEDLAPPADAREIAFFPPTMVG
jgi:molybdopterin converting factor small subunit